MNDPEAVKILIPRMITFVSQCFHPISKEKLERLLPVIKKTSARYCDEAEALRIQQYSEFGTPQDMNATTRTCLRRAFRQWLAIMVVSRIGVGVGTTPLRSPPGPHERNSLAVDPINFLSIDSIINKPNIG